MPAKGTRWSSLRPWLSWTWVVMTCPASVSTASSARRRAGARGRSRGRCRRRRARVAVEQIGERRRRRQLVRDDLERQPDAGVGGRLRDRLEAAAHRAGVVVAWRNGLPARQPEVQDRRTTQPRSRAASSAARVSSIASCRLAALTGGVRVGAAPDARRGSRRRSARACCWPSCRARAASRAAPRPARGRDSRSACASRTPR